MSRFSGKCDFYDTVCMIHCDGDESKIEEFLARTRIYVLGKDDRYHLLDIKTEKDAAKYYPYLTAIGAFNKEEGNFIHLSGRSFIDTEEAEHIGWKIEDVQKYWRKCKRDKVSFTKEGCLSKIYHWGDISIYEKIIDRVLEDGNKAEFDDIHDDMHEYFRREWFRELRRLGYSQFEAYRWCFNDMFPDEDIVKERLGELYEDE